MTNNLYYTLNSDEIAILKKLRLLTLPVVFKNLFHNVLSLEEFENILNLTPFTSTERFVPTFPIPEFEWQLPYWNTGSNHWPINIVEELVNTGACYLRDCSRLNPKINQICSVIETETNNAVDAHVYFSKSSQLENGFGIHKDLAHNFIIQIEGQTHWKVGTNFYTDDRDNLEEWRYNDKLSIDVILNPGDAIFVPANVYHSAKPLSKRISISFPMPANKSIYFENRKWINWND